MKSRYFDLMEKILNAYTDQDISDYYNRVKRDGIKEHGFPRLTANIGILISNGRRKDLYSMFEKMMDLCCDEFLKDKEPQKGNDFSVKEIIFCLIEIEKSQTFPTEKTLYWRSLLEKIEYEKCYNVYAKTKEDIEYNWALFTAVSEFMREKIGLADTGKFVDVQIATQLNLLDENGMYRDPNNPMVYDLVSRGLFCVLMHFGYDGEYRKEIDECLKRTGLLTLKMQSVSGEIPYGGRSNQFLHNEAHIALLLEYEANRYFMQGDLKLAGQFKAAAEKAIASIEKWVSEEKISHVKNHYPIESKYGCEGYAYFDKYMITAASFLYVSSLFSNENIKPVKIENCANVFSLSDDFHKTFLRYGKWFLELDTNADEHYDSNGIGRVHCQDAPTEICLSTPGTATPSYTVDISECEAFSICLGILKNDEFVFGTKGSVKYNKLSENLGEDFAEASFECDFGDNKNAKMVCRVESDAVYVDASADCEVAIMLPAFVYDGEKETKLLVNENSLEVFYNGFVCRYTSNGEICDTGKIGCNRNGHYKFYFTKKMKYVSVKIEISEVY